jgi:hypothetical protein
MEQQLDAVQDIEDWLSSDDSPLAELQLVDSTTGKVFGIHCNTPCSSLLAHTLLSHLRTRDMLLLW